TDKGDVIAIAPVSPIQRAKRAWRLRPWLRFDQVRLAPDTLRVLALCAASATPALGFFAGIDASVLAAAGIGAATAMMLLSLHAQWRAAAWAGMVTAAAWALAGLVLGAAHASPIRFAVFVSVAALAGLAHAHMRRVGPGSATALAMAGAALALASQTAMIGPAGAAYGVIVAAGAVAGAMSLRLEGVHFGAFGAALIGLFVLSGQPDAAIWFTPAATWAGALFLGIAVVRVPQLGARGLALAGIGALAPLSALSALHLAQHGLADRFAAAGAFAGLSVMLVGLIAAAALRRPHGLVLLKATLWVLAAGAFAAMAAAIQLAAPAPLAALAFAILSLALALLNTVAPHGAWRAFACIGALFAAASALGAGALLLSEAQGWPPMTLIGLGLAAPAAVIAFAATFARRGEATGGLLEAVAFTLATVAANLAVRLFFSGGAMLLQPVGFVEAGAHISVLLAASLLIASRSHLGSTRTRVGFAVLLGLIALMLSAFACGLWLTSYWSTRDVLPAPIGHEPLGFLAPAMLFWAHWAFWRGRGEDMRTRTALAAAALLSAAYVTLELMRWPAAAEWVGVLGGAIAFALAIVANFAPGVTAARPRHRSYGEEKLHRQRRGQQRA
ncbi:MAG: hypothetical protein ACREH4_08110, partial [Vitreimonas sp.]